MRINRERIRYEVAFTNMSITDILKTGANVSFTISALDLREWMLELIAEHDLHQNQSSASPEKYLTAQETADKLGVDVSTLWRWDKSGYLKKIKIGNKTRYHESDVLKLMEG